jgi:PIN domain nuclease of toxin-antitoxin system
VGRRALILLDTHAWVWWAAEPRKLSPRARKAIESAEEIGVSAISPWEVAMLVSKFRLELDRDVLLWVRQALALPRVTLIPLSPEIAVASTTLGLAFPGDPADRIIAATALRLRAPLVTRDRRLRSLKTLSTIW